MTHIPPPAAINDNSGQAIRSLRERCATMGLATWRCDNSGLVLEEPIDSGQAMLFWSSSPIMQAVSKTAAAWARAQTPQIAELFPGAWAVPLPEHRRRTRTGCVLALALSEGALTSEFFRGACAVASLDPQALRRTLLGRARYTRESAASLRDAALWMAQDLLHVEECDKTASGFTRQLSDAFETIDLLYATGRSMNDLTRPTRFIDTLVSRLRTTLSFGWVACWFNGTGTTAHEVRHVDDAAGRGEGGGEMDLSGKTLIAGSTDLLSGLDRSLPAMLVASRAEARATILTQLGGVPVPGSGQVLAQPILRAGRPVGFLLAGDKFGDDPQVSSYDIQLLEAAAGYIGAFLDNAGLYSEQKALFLGVLESLTAAIDAKDPYTSGHSRRVSQLSWQLATASGMTVHQAERVRIAGLVHDVGKIGVPEAVLCKTGRLTDEEFEAIKKHPEIGHRILRDMPLLKDILPGVLYHHERWDGRGYPMHLRGEAIPPMARIIALADTFDAMSSTRSYRSAMCRTAVLAEIVKCAGQQFEPGLARLFVTLDFSEYDRMVAQHQMLQPPAVAAAA